MGTVPPIVQAFKLQLLPLVQQACAELGIRQPSQIFGATDNQTIQLLALAQREMYEFGSQGQRIGGWEELRKQYVFSLNGATGYTGTTTAGSPIITGINVNPNILITSINTSNSWGIICPNVPNDAHVVSVDSTSQITLDTNASITGSVAFSLGQDGYVFPTDFGYYQPMTTWDRSFRWQILGPLEAQEWQVLKSGISPTGPRRRFRIMAGIWYVDPVPTAPETIVFEYFSNTLTQDFNNTPQDRFYADSDYYNFDDQILILGIQWRWKAKKGLDYSQEKRDYDLRLERLMSRNGTTRDLPMNAQSTGMRLLNSNNVPDTGFGA